MVSQGVDTATFNYDSLAAKIQTNQNAYKTLSLRAKLVWDDGTTEQQYRPISGFTDSIVWMTYYRYSWVWEGGRVLIHPDTFKLVRPAYAANMSYTILPMSITG